MAANKKLLILPGDGIGPEVTAEAVRVLRAVGKSSGASFEFEPALVGGRHSKRDGGDRRPDVAGVSWAG